LTQDRTSPDEATSRAAGYIAQALNELQQSASASSGELATKADIRGLAETIQRQLAAETEQRVVLVGQLTGLATSLDLLVVHLQSLAQLMGDLVERVAEPGYLRPLEVPPEPEPAFLAGGEGVSLILAAVPGFQSLMDIQKALMALSQVEGVSVERFQEGESRLLLHLSAPITANHLVEVLHLATNQAVTIEESRPELSRLRLKIVPSA
jgi:hypothetical protein